MCEKCEIIRALLKAAVIWEWQQSHAYLYAGVFGFFAYVQMSLSLRKGEHMQEFCWYAKLQVGDVKCTEMLEHIHTSVK